MSTVTRFDAQGNGTTVSGGSLLTASMSDVEATALLTSGKVTSEEFCEWLAVKTFGKGWHPRPPKLKVTADKGCLHIGNCHNKKFGLALYVSTIEYLYSIRDDVEVFIKAHQASLARK